MARKNADCARLSSSIGNKHRISIESVQLLEILEVAVSASLRFVCHLSVTHPNLIFLTQKALLTASDTPFCPLL
jgi:hypothetical protein